MKKKKKKSLLFYEVHVEKEQRRFVVQELAFNCSLDAGFIACVKGNTGKNSLNGNLYKKKKNPSDAEGFIKTLQKK